MATSLYTDRFDCIYIVTTERSGARVARNTLANGGARLLGVAVFLFLTPFLISQLGASAYGVFTIALSLSFLDGYTAFTDLGIEASGARFIAEARSNNDFDRVNQR